MRIVIAALHYFPDKPSGSTRLAYDEAKELANLGHEVWYIGQKTDDTHAEFEIDNGIHVLRYSSYKSKNIIAKINFHQKAIYNLLEKYNVSDVSLVRGHVAPQYKGALDFFDATTKTSYSIHSPILLEYRAASYGEGIVSRLYNELRGRALSAIEKRCLLASDHITSDSKFTKNIMGKLYGNEVYEQIIHQPAWINTKEYSVPAKEKRVSFKQELGWSKEKITFFTLRRLVPRNGIENLVRAASILKSAGYDFELIIGGKGPLETQLINLTHQLQLEDHINFIGYIEEDMLHKHYGAADCFILPTAKLECFGLIILESMATGTPVIGTPVGAIPELIENISPELILDDITPEAIAKGMQMFIDQKFVLPSSKDFRLYAEQFDKDINLQMMTKQLNNLIR